MANPIHDVRGIFNAQQRMAGAEGLTLVEEDYCDQPRTCLKTKRIFVPRLSPYWSKHEVLMWIAKVGHECNHHSKKCADALPFMEGNKIGFGSLLGMLINVFEDIRVDFNKWGIYPGNDQANGYLHAHCCSNGAKGIAEHGIKDKDKLLVCHALAMSYAHRVRYQPDLAKPSLEFNKVVDWEKYSHLLPLLDSLNTIEDVYNVAIQMIEASDDHDSEEEKAKAAESAEKGEGEPEDAEGSSEGDGKSEGSDEEGKGTKKEVSYEDIMGHRHTEKDGEGYTKIVYDHKPINNYKPWPDMKVMKARELRTSRDCIPEIRAIYNNGTTLASAARRLFQSVTQSRISHNHLTGRLDKRDLYRIPSGCKDVFKRKEKRPDPKGTAVFLLTDASASMGTTKFFTTAAAVALLNDACSPLKIPMKIAAFTEKYGGCEHFIVKEYDEKRSNEHIFSDYSNIHPRCYQNADGESVMWAATDLMARPEPRKILIVLSDGSPCADNYGDCYTYTKDVIAHVSKWPSLELYGIGILDSTVSELYPESVVLKRVNQLETCLLDLIKHKIFKL